MKPVTMKFSNDKGEVTKTFVTCSLKTGDMDSVIDVMEKAEKIERDHVTTKEVKEFYYEMKLLMIQLFKHQFSIEEMNENVEQEELTRSFKELCENMKGNVAKN